MATPIARFEVRVGGGGKNEVFRARSWGSCLLTPANVGTEQRNSNPKPRTTKNAVDVTNPQARILARYRKGHAMSGSRRNYPSFAALWSAGADWHSRRELLGLWARRYRRVPGRKLLRRLGKSPERFVDLQLAHGGGCRLRLRRKDGGDHASFFENFFEIPYDITEFGTPRLIVDAGAHVGCFTARLHQWFPDAEIVSFEPEPANAKLLDENFRLNAIKGRVVDKALWIEDTTLEFLAGKSNGGRLAETSSDFDAKAVAGRLTETVKVPATSLQSVLGERLKDVDLLKLDIEGAELDVLDHDLPLVSPKTVILCEVHYLERNRARFEELLEKHGWTGKLVDDSHPPHSCWILRKK
ncbi:MAG: hypothetical protein PWP23_3214 [Candidatus Sumerlaeota bacterium]|nr:hypothetical protein [Candidatus Sumerlaeota bacterium]